jgi:hypothetical protein
MEIEANDRPRYYHPKNRVKTPSYYPQTRLRHLTDRALISRLDLDQLFYIFYYREGTYEQYVLFLSSLILFWPLVPSLLSPLSSLLCPFLHFVRGRVAFQNYEKAMNPH